VRRKKKKKSSKNVQCMWSTSFQASRCVVRREAGVENKRGKSKWWRRYKRWVRFMRDAREAGKYGRTQKKKVRKVSLKIREKFRSDANKTT